MGRKRTVGNERLAEHVQRRSSGILELRFPIPSDVRHAFLDQRGRPRPTIIRSLGTNDIRIANAKADALKTHLRDEVRRVREAASSDSLGDHLRWLYDYDLAAFRREQDYMAEERRREQFNPRQRATPLLVSASSTRMSYGRALLSENPEERESAAGWAADEFFLRRGEEPDRKSPQYRVVLEECVRVLLDAVVAKEELDHGRPEPKPVSEALAQATTGAGGRSNALTDRGRLSLTAYFDAVYAPRESRDGVAPKGERNISGKRHSVRLFTELAGNVAVCAITKGHLYEFLDQLQDYPDSRLLSGDLKNASAARVLAKIRSGELKLPPMSPKTANKHLTNLSAILQFAERRRDISSADTKGVKIRVDGGDQGAGRAFTADELNRIFALPLFSGCAGEDVEAGLFKPGDVMIRDDRFWIPLVLLFSGARSAEIVGMLTTEAVIDHEVPHFLIQPNSVRVRLKNHHSKRMVPIHSRLIGMGFLDFVRQRAAMGDERLFPLAVQTTYRDGATGVAIPRSLSASLIMRQFNRTILDHANARADGGSIKCFRNTFEQESMSKISSDEMRQRLTGRKVVSTARIYTDNIPYDPTQRTVQLARLKREMECITYDAVKLSHLEP